MLEPKPKITIEVINQVKKIMMEAFGTASLPDDPEGLFNKTEEALSSFYSELKNYNASYSAGRLYPGRDIVQEGLKLLDKLLCLKDELQFFQSLIEHKEDLLDITEDTEPVSHSLKARFGIDRALSDYNRL